MKIRYHAHNETSGYGKAASGYIEALKLAGANVDRWPMEGISEALPTDIAIYHSTPARLMNVGLSNAKKHVAVTTWETSELPKALAMGLARFNALIVPSEFCEDVLVDHCLNVFMVPHGFDPTKWPLSSQRENDVYRFYTIGAWGERKNTLGVLKAYLNTFKKGDRTSLTMIVDKADFQAMHSLLARSLLPKSDLPSLHIPEGRLSDDDIYRIHRDNDCFVSTTRGEGFGLPHFEAAVMGKRIISSMWGGQYDFLRDYRSLRKIDSFLTPVFPAADDVTVVGNAMSVLATIPQGANCRQMWAEPNLSQVCFYMKEAYEDFLDSDSMVVDFSDNRAFFEKEYSFAAIGAKFFNVLKKIKEQV